jgi:hypothetical protein
VVRPDQPCRHPTPSRRQVSDARVDVIPTEFGAAAMRHGSLNVVVELAKVMKRSCCIKSVQETGRRLACEPKHGHGALARAAADTCDVVGIGLSVAAKRRGRMSQGFPASRCGHRLPPILRAQILE